MKKLNDSLLPENDHENRKNMRMLLEKARSAYEDRRTFLKKRKRSFRMYLGNQWGDKMEDPKDPNKTITEEKYIKRQGRMPAQNNQIGTVVRNLIGQFRNNYPDPVAFGRNRDQAQTGEIMTAALQKAIDINEGDELDARNFEELLVSASTGWKVTFKWWSDLNMNDAFVENIDQTRFFFNMDTNDIRGKDISMVGEIHDMRMDDIISSFANSKADAERIRNMFPEAEAYKGHATNKYPEYLKTYKDFYSADDATKARVIEIWNLENRWQSFIHDSSNGRYIKASDEYFSELGFSPEEIQLYNYEELVYFYNQDLLRQAQQAGVTPDSAPLLDINTKYEEIWRVYYLSPLGEVLYESDTPYEHEEHPYTFGLYPLFDGKTMSVVESITDQQKYINRLIGLMDAALGSSIKNLMWVPKSIVPDDMSPEEFSQQAIELNGMMFYEDDANTDLPTPMSTNANIAGTKELLVLQMNLLKEISAVNDAVQGAEPPSGTPASLYAQQAANASMSNKDIFDYYFSLLRKRNRKIVQVMQQFYTEKRYIKIAGSNYQNSVDQMYDPDKVQGIDFDVVLGETQNTLAYRQLVDTYLKSFLDENRITFEEYLKNTSLPFADQLLQTVSHRMDGNQGQGGIPPAMQKQIANGNITPEIVQKLGLDQGKKRPQSQTGNANKPPQPPAPPQQPHL